MTEQELQRADTGAAYWLDCSPHERTEADGLIVAQAYRELRQRIGLALDYANRNCSGCKGCDEWDCPSWIVQAILNGEPCVKCAECGDPLRPGTIPIEFDSPLCDACAAELPQLEESEG